MNGSIAWEIEDLKRGLSAIRNATDQLEKRVLKVEERARMTGQERDLLLNPISTLKPAAISAPPPAAPPRVQDPVALRPQLPPASLKIDTGAGVVESAQSPALETVSRPSLVPPLIQRKSDGVQLESKEAPGMAPGVSQVDDAVSGGSLEMRLGTYWFVRIGIGMLLTGMVFLANYAYQNFVGMLGAPGKVGILYLLSFGLAGLGAWMGRPSGRESLRGYSKVLFSGGLAAVYFTTYAAHHVANLRVIENPILAGFLLVFWAGIVAWIADRRNSGELAMGSIALAYYASCITGAGKFTLVSNLLLAGFSLVLVSRRKWSALSFGSLIAVYVGYAFWRFHRGGEWAYSNGIDDAVWGYSFLVCYWLMFTASLVFISGDAVAAGRNGLFATLNNTLFFLIFSQSLWLDHSDHFWIFSLATGAVYAGCAFIVRRRAPNDEGLTQVYLGQGLFLLTLGIIARFSGLTLALLLAVESAGLMVASTWRGGRLVRAASMLTGIGAGLLACAQSGVGVEQSMTRAGVGLILAFNGWWSRRGADQGRPIQLRPLSFMFSALALLVWFLALGSQVSAHWSPSVFAVAALVIGVVAIGLRFPEMALISQAFFLPAIGLSIFGALEGGGNSSVWSPLIVAVAGIAACHCWKSIASRIGGEKFAVGLEALVSAGVIAILIAWCEQRMAPTSWMMLASVLAVGVTGYGILTGLRLLAAISQLLFAVAVAGWFRLTFAGHAPGWETWVVIAVGFGVARLGMVLSSKLEADNGLTLRGVAQVYDGTCVAMALGWGWSNVPHAWLGAAWIGMAAVLIGGGLMARNLRSLQAGVVFLAAAGGALIVFHSARNAPISLFLQMGLPLVAALALQQAARRFVDRVALDEQIHRTWIVAIVAGLGLFASHWATSAMGGRVLETLAFAAMGMTLFAAGIGLRERGYRRGGLVLLGVAICKAVLVDVWTLTLPYRIVCFLGLGVALLLLGFFYNRWQDRIRKWL